MAVEIVKAGKEQVESSAAAGSDDKNKWAPIDEAQVEDNKPYKIDKRFLGMRSVNLIRILKYVLAMKFYKDRGVELEMESDKDISNFEVDMFFAYFQQMDDEAKSYTLGQALTDATLTDSDMVILLSYARNNDGVSYAESAVYNAADPVLLCSIFRDVLLQVASMDKNPFFFIPKGTVDMVQSTLANQRKQKAHKLNRGAGSAAKK